MKTLALFSLLFISTATLHAMQDEQPISPEFNYFDKIKFNHDLTYDNGVAIPVHEVSARHIPSMRIYIATKREGYFENAVMKGFSYHERWDKSLQTSLDNQTAKKVYSMLLMAGHLFTPKAQKKEILDELHKLIKTSAEKANHQELDLGFLSAV